MYSVQWVRHFKLTLNSPLLDHALLDTASPEGLSDGAGPPDFNENSLHMEYVSLSGLTTLQPLRSREVEIRILTGSFTTHNPLTVDNEGNEGVNAVRRLPLP